MATEQVEGLVAHREVVGLLALVFFSSTAFTVIESAMAIIFYHRTVTQRRHLPVSVLRDRPRRSRTGACAAVSIVSTEPDL
ncbi:MAG: hypothetical protein WAP47_21135 [Candidatus Rokuibacteriota bacterium]